MGSVSITSDPGIITLTGDGSIVIGLPSPDWNPNMDYTYDCNEHPDEDTRIGRGIGVINLSGGGSRLGYTCVSSTGMITLSGDGTHPQLVIITSGAGVITLSGNAKSATVGLIPKGNPWVKWSKVGRIDFTIDKSNQAGERPMEYGGWNYAIKKLGNQVVAYGENGVSIMSASGVIWGLKTLIRTGLKSKNAVCGNEDTHFFIDKEGTFWILKAGGGLTSIDYSNHLNSLNTKTVMHYDEQLQAVYITDGSLGFIWTESGLGKCPPNITGMGYRAGVFYCVSPTSSIVTDPMEVCTDIWDGNSREEKEIMQIDVGTDVAQDLYGSIYYRWDKASEFSQTPWVKANRGGEIFVTASGIEFKFALKLLLYSSIRLDYGRISVKYMDRKPLGNA